jgi:hypothetical protein
MLRPAVEVTLALAVAVGPAMELVVGSIDALIISGMRRFYRNASRDMARSLLGNIHGW